MFYFNFSFYFDSFLKKKSEVEGATLPHPVESVNEKVVYAPLYVMQLLLLGVPSWAGCWEPEQEGACGLGAQRKVIHQEEGQEALLGARQPPLSAGLKKAEESTLASF